jgi:RND family efflux transporter MFP subunit
MKVPLLVLAGLAGLACTPAQPIERSPTAAPRQIPAARVSDAHGPATYRAAGTVRAARRVELATRVMGRIETVRARAGDPVRRGQVLLTIDRASLSASQGQARSGLELAEKTLRRAERLYADSAATLVQLEAARNGYSQAEAQSRAVAADLAYTDLQAPFDGVITSRMADPGDMAAPGQPLLILEDKSAREIVVTVPDELRERLRVGQEVPVRIGARERAVTARITAVVAGADPRSPALEVRLVGPSSLAPGLAAVAELPAGDRRTLLVPRSALVERGQLEGVYLFAPDSTLRLRWVRTGAPEGNAIEVVSGLNAGDSIALDASKVHDGLVALPLLEGPED